MGELMEWIPESAAWLDDAALLRPRLRRRAAGGGPGDPDAARHDRRRDARRAAPATAGTAADRDGRDPRNDHDRQSSPLPSTTITDVTIQATLRAVRREIVPPEDADLDFSVIAMGRFGGAELGFGRTRTSCTSTARTAWSRSERSELAVKLVSALRSYSEDQRVPLELDADLRPEGRNGPIAPLDAYEEYYRRWAVPWRHRRCCAPEAWQAA